MFTSTTCLWVLLLALCHAFPAASQSLNVPRIQDDFITVIRANDMAELAQVTANIDSNDDSTIQSNLPDSYTFLKWINTGETQVLMVRSNDENSLIVVVQTEDDGNFFTSLEEWLSRDKPQTKLSADIPPMSFVNALGVATQVDVMVDQEFRREFLRVYGEIESTLKPLLDEEDDFKVHMTGHSRGGAVAMLVATQFAVDHPTVEIRLTTFGQPRVGNLGFKIFCESLRNLNSWRLVHGIDPVARTPFSLTNYQHAGHLLWKKPDGDDAQAFYRQIGAPSQNFEGTLDLGLATFLDSEDVNRFHALAAYRNDWLIPASNQGENPNLFATSFERK